MKTSLVTQSFTFLVIIRLNIHDGEKKVLEKIAQGCKVKDFIVNK